MTSPRSRPTTPPDSHEERVIQAVGSSAFHGTLFLLDAIAQDLVRHPDPLRRLMTPEQAHTASETAL